MRTPIRRVTTLAASIVLAACSSGTTIIVRQPPPPPPPPPRVEPLEITVARPVRGHLLVQTNRPSYVALFEIVPDRGVALLAPSYAHQRTWMLAGLNWVPVSWKVQSTMYYGPPAGTAIPARWVYAIASDEPLRLPDEAFQPSYMRRVLGPAAYRGTNPYVTMRAIARVFLPSVIDESWAEDAYALAATYASDPYRTVRIYCSNRTVYEVPEEMANRAWCPVHAPAGGTVVRSVPTRPDSIVATNGQRVRRRYPETTPVRAPIDRVSEPTRSPIDRAVDRINEPPRSDNAPVATDNSVPRNDTPVKDAKEKERRNNGNAYGHTDDPNVKGRGIENEKQNNGKADKADKVKIEKDIPVDVQPRDPRTGPRVDTPVSNPQQVQPDDRQPENKQAEKVEAKQEKQEEKQLRREEKQEEKAVEKAEKAEQKLEAPPVTIEPPRQQETPVEKPEAKPEQKEEKAEAKAEEKSTGKPDEKPQNKPGIKPPWIKDQKNKP